MGEQLSLLPGSSSGASSDIVDRDWCGLILRGPTCRKVVGRNREGQYLVVPCDRYGAIDKSARPTISTWRPFTKAGKAS
mgnify:CR=1 FL=1